MTEKPDETEIFNCAHCGVPILTWWDGNGHGMLRGEYLLAGDLVFHPKCWRDYAMDIAETPMS